MTDSARHSKESTLKTSAMLRAAGLAWIAFALAAGAATERTVLDVKPGVLVCPDIDGFEIRNRTGSVYDHIDGPAILAFEINGGMGFDLDNQRDQVDFLLGWSPLLRGGIEGNLFTLSASGRRQVAKYAHLGLLVGAAALPNPAWSASKDAVAGFDEDDIEMGGTGGGVLGLDFTLGGKTVAFTANVSLLLLASLDVESRNESLVLSDDSMNLSGLAVHLGAKVRF